MYKINFLNKFGKIFSLVIILLGIISILLSGCVSTVRQDFQKNKKNMQTLLSYKEKAVVDLSPGKLPKSVNLALDPVFHETNLPFSEDNTFDIVAKAQPAKKFFVNLVRNTPYSVAVFPNVSGTIDISMKDTTVPKVMDMMHKIYGFSYEEQNNTFIIKPYQMETRIFTINHLNMKREGVTNTEVSAEATTLPSNNEDGESGSSSSSSDSGNTVGTNVVSVTNDNYWDDLKTNIGAIIGLTETAENSSAATVATQAGSVEDNPSVTINAESGVVVVHAYPKALNEVSKYIRKVNLIDQQQVLIEAKVLEVQLNKTFASGINWKAIGLSSTLISSSFSNPPFGNILELKGSSGDFNAVFQYLETVGRVSVISSPRILTLNNQKAVIKVGTNRYFVTNVTSNFAGDSLGNTSNVASDISFEPFFSGVSLDVTPIITEEGKVMLHLHPVISRVQTEEQTVVVDGRTSTLPLATSNIRESDSEIVASDGQMIIIGGLMENASDLNRSGLPHTTIHTLDNFLTAKSDLSNNIELVILLKPSITKDNNNYWRQLFNEEHSNIDALLSDKQNTKQEKK